MITQANLELCSPQYLHPSLQLCIVSSLLMLVSIDLQPTYISFSSNYNDCWIRCVIVMNFLGTLPTGSAGLGFLQFCNLNSFRTKFILGFSVFMGLSVPQYFNEYTSVAGYGPVHTHSRWVCTAVFHKSYSSVQR